MGQKTNPVGFRLAYKKSWENPSFYEKFNYNKNINQDHNVLTFVKGFLSFLNINHHNVFIRRLNSTIFISIIFYTRDFMFKDDLMLYKPRHLISSLGKTFKNLSFKSRNNVFKSRKKSYGLFFNSFNLFESFRFDRSVSKDSTFWNNINLLKFKFIVMKQLNDLISNNENLSIIDKFSVVYSKNIFTTKFQYKLWFLFLSVILKKYIVQIRKNNKALIFYLMLNFYANQSKFNKGKDLSVLSGLKSNLLLKNQKIVKNKEGLSLKRLISLFVTKLTGISNVQVSLIQLNKPKRDGFKFFNALQRNIRVKGPLKNKIQDLFLVLYQSMLLKSPAILNSYLVNLIKYNIKSVRQIFSILENSVPYFCTVFNFKGMKIELKGRINGSKRSRVQKIQYGRIPLSTISSRVFYSMNKSMTIHGVYSLKIWYYF